MSLQTSIVVNVSLSAAQPSGPSFGGALIAGYHTVGGSQRILGPYGSQAAVIAAGFPANSPIALAAGKYFGQNPTPTQVYVGRRALPYTQIWKLTPLSITNGDTYVFTVGATGGVGGTQVTYTVSGSPTLAALCTALASALGTAVGSGTATGASGTFVQWTSGTAGTLVEFNNQALPILDFVENTTDPGVATDLAAIYQANPSAWYGLILDSNSRQEIEAAAAWVESNFRLFPCSSADTQAGRQSLSADGALNPVSAMYFVQNGSYSRTAVMLNAYSNMAYAGAAWMGVFLPQVPGSYTAAYKGLAGVQADTLPSGWDTNVFAKRGSVYTTMGGVATTQFGMTGNGEFLDTVVFIDWLKSTMQIAVLALLLNNPKVSFDDDGINLIAGTVLGVLKQGETAKGLVRNSSSVSPPLASSVGATDKGNRNLPNLPWSAKLAGAIHTIVINGVLTQ